ncbi:hypothetical protein AB0H58_32415 [Nocardia neocaledoniensis]|uniref:hypothetical protein n=1 Tax=Nocardia neocaledoniensis TaxID=236511 RepID=UPI0033E48E95
MIRLRRPRHHEPVVDVDDTTDLHTQVLVQARRIQQLTAMVDDVIDAMDALRPAIASDHAGLPIITGVIRGQTFTPMTRSCHDPGIGLTVAQAKQVTREHMDCSCRIRAAAYEVLDEAGTVRRSRR